MIYTDLERIYKISDVENKYALAMVISTRARQLSEQKGRQIDGDGSERYITHAIEEIERDRLNIKSTFTHHEGAENDASEMGAL
ncbi:MAG: DNA-directed RNA polymerase subunit omega [Synergistaceae bacterium]|jgi:DNA-directed RNA polymerase omega subunit|nr:DNA-directed RNA polymerase subunit omega [Synergistaceae bacterium]